VSLLGLFGRSDHSCSNCPDRFISNNNLAPVFDLLADGTKLSSVDSVSFSGFTLLKFFADASHYLEAVFKRNLHLGCDISVGLAKDMAPLTVPQNDPSQTEVLNHCGGSLTSEGTVSVKRTVLCGELNLGTCKSLLSSTQVDEGGGNNNLNFVLIEYECFQHICGELTAEVNITVALPVSSNEQFTHGYGFCLVVFYEKLSCDVIIYIINPARTNS
jgi:hypothetical protein